MSLATGGWFNKTPSADTVLARTSKRFLWCWLLFLLFSSLEVFMFPCYFFVLLALHPGFSGPWGPPPALSSTLATFGCSTFARPFRRSFTARATILSGHFLPTGVFLPYAPSPHFWHVLWLRCGQGHPIQDPPLCLPLETCPFRLRHGLDLLILIYQLRQWATKYRVKIKLVYMFRLFKVIRKDYKNTLNKTW